MKIEKLRVNHIENPLGYDMKKIVFSWVVSESTGKFQRCARIRISNKKNMETLVFDSGEQENISSLGYEVPFIPDECTRYYWDVTVTDDLGNTGKSQTAWFETAKGEAGICGQWIGSPFQQNIHPAFYRKFYLSKPVCEARFYGTALGVFECYVNGIKAGEEYLAPFYTDYNNWLQYVTYDITDMVREGENAFGAKLGNGWYKGRFGFIDKLDELYGNRFQFLGEIRVKYEDGTVESIGTDTGWSCAPSEIISSSIYDGEVIDARRTLRGFATVQCEMERFRPATAETGTAAQITPRLSPEVRIMEKRKPERLLHTPKGEWVLDFGQVMTGWVEIDVNLEEGRELFLQYGELLQDDCFYNENLRTAKEEFRYISNGDSAHVRPHFTFYGFRYVKVTGLKEIELTDFTACVIYSDIAETGYLETSDEKVNQLISNTKWGQKGNFLDVPTDCPQRDERMGWTGDAQVFCAAASYHMYTPAFFRKYMYDMKLEQENNAGAVPHVVPDILGQIRKIMGEVGGMEPYGSCAWGDAATVIPWTMYLFYGDKSLLEEQYEGMKAWVNYIRNVDVKYCGGQYLWKHGFHYGDWLALDNPEKGSSFGGTDPYYVASAYYYYSAVLTSKAAEVLGKRTDADYYCDLAEKVKSAIQKEYFADGTLKLKNQTALILALYFGFAPEQSRKQLIETLKTQLDKNNKHMDTGFVGTAYLCLALTEVGLSDYAYTLLLNEDYPSWLYEVNMGATTVWERWNSVLENGKVSDTGMNSMNHYAYGAVAEWIYRGICGLNPVWEEPGFKKVRIAPQIDKRLSGAKMIYDSASGEYRSEWHIEGDRVVFQISIPFDVKAEFYFPEHSHSYTVNQKSVQKGMVELTAGKYELTAILS